MRAPTLLKRTLGRNPVSRKNVWLGEGSRKDQMGQRELGSGVEVVGFFFFSCRCLEAVGRQQPNRRVRTLGRNPVSQKISGGGRARKDQMGQRELGSGVEAVVFFSLADAWKQLEVNSRIVGWWATCLQRF
ncbi:hypothetical protein CEXT_640901 [Caerostris extrusa]|uniref:Uncharacterized protein n=1 Tax=Caerostris extrusa TaxID=172846 RepID=A0AAV4MZ08_CAEEX|nr:hypothetical protein CEXT_640901 [Caerostris extrusa]